MFWDAINNCKINPKLEGVDDVCACFFTIPDLDVALDPAKRQVLYGTAFVSTSPEPALNSNDVESNRACGF